MQYDKNVVESAERIEAIKHSTENQRIAARNETIQIIAVVVAAACVLISFFGNCTSCENSKNIQKIEIFRLEKEEWESCVNLAGVDGCWRISYQNCIKKEPYDYCKELIPKSERN